MDAGRTASLSGLTVANGNAGGIFVSFLGTLGLSDCIISGNSATTRGGGIANEGTLTVSGCIICGNSAIGAGGGIANSGTLTLSGSTLSGNVAQSPDPGIFFSEGGGIFNQAGIFDGTTVTVSDCNFIDNSAGQGGGIYNAFEGGLTVRGSTFTGKNTASDSGGGIYNLGTATLQECTLSGNTAGSAGGGIFNGSSGALTVKDSTALHNVAPLGADLDNLGALTLDDSTVGVLGP